MSARKINEIVPVDDAFVQMGEQLTAQYKRAVSGMIEVVKFGAMMMQVRDSLTGVQVRTPEGTWAGGDGLKAWLAEYAPEVKRATAYRFLGVTDAVMQDYANIVGARVAKKYSLPELVTAEDLPKNAQLKQLELFDYISGTSQRSWLSMFDKPEIVERGGAREGAGRPKLSPADKEELARVHWTDVHRMICEGLSKGELDPLQLTAEEMANLDGTLLDLRRHLKAALTPNN